MPFKNLKYTIDTLYTELEICSTNDIKRQHNIKSQLSNVFVLMKRIKTGIAIAKLMK
jgi:hypothetical protein